MTAAKWPGDVEFDSVWDRFVADDYAGCATTLGTIYAHAKAAGWQESASRPANTDTGNAQRFAKFVTGRLRHVHGFRMWLAWVEHEARWVFCRQGEEVEIAKACAVQILKDAANEPDPDKRTQHVKHALKVQNASPLQAMLDLAKSDPLISTAADRLDSDLCLLGVSNGAVNLRTGMLQVARREQLITKQAGTVYDPKAKCPNFEKTVNTAFAGDRALIDYFQRACGSALCGEIREHVFFFCYGTGANGKSTLLNAIQEAMGDYAISLPIEALMKGKRDAAAASPDLMMLRGARLALAPETEDGQQLAESRIKQLTGGDRVTARALYGDCVNFQQTAKLFIVGNHKPQVSGTDEGIWRRVQLIPFNVCIPEAQRDTSLPKKIQAELPGILAWLVRGCVAWQKSGLKPPTTVVGATMAYKQESDILNEWRAECCTANPTAISPAGDLYPAYRNWALRNGHHPWSNTRWGKRMSEHFAKGRSSTGTVTYAGVELNATGRRMIAMI